MSVLRLERIRKHLLQRKFRRRYIIFLCRGGIVLPDAINALQYAIVIPGVFFNTELEHATQYRYGYIIVALELRQIYLLLLVCI